MNKRPALDLDMLAYDIANMIDRLGHPISEHVGDTEIRAALPAFLTALGLGLDGQPLIDSTPMPASLAVEPTRHNCNPRRPGQPLPFGRKAPKGECPRCDELHEGAAPREAPGWVDDRRREQLDAETYDRHRREHFAPGGPHATGACGPVCTAFDS